MNTLRALGAVGTAIGGGLLLWGFGDTLLKKQLFLAPVLALVFAAVVVELFAQSAAGLVGKSPWHLVWLVPVCGLGVVTGGSVGVALGNLLTGSATLDDAGRVMLAGVVGGGTIAAIVGAVLGVVGAAVTRAG